MQNGKRKGTKNDASTHAVSRLLSKISHVDEEEPNANQRKQLRKVVGPVPPPPSFEPWNAKSNSQGSDEQIQLWKDLYKFLRGQEAPAASPEVLVDPTAALAPLKRLRRQGYLPKPWSELQNWAAKHHLLPVLRMLGSLIMEGTLEALMFNGYKVDNGAHVNLGGFRNQNPVVRWFNLRHKQFTPRRQADLRGELKRCMICTEVSVAEAVLKLRKSESFSKHRIIVGFDMDNLQSGSICPPFAREMQGSNFVGTDKSVQQSLLFRSDLCKFLETAMRDGTSLRERLIDSPAPSVLGCPKVTFFRGAAAEGHPFISKPESVDVVIAGLQKSRPRVRQKNRADGGVWTGYVDEKDAEELWARLELLNAGALLLGSESLSELEGRPDAAPPLPMVEDEKPILILAALGCHGRGQHPPQDVAGALKRFRKAHASQYHSVLICCGDSQVAKQMDRKLNEEEPEPGKPSTWESRNLGWSHVLQELANALGPNSKSPVEEYDKATRRRLSLLTGGSKERTLDRLLREAICPEGEDFWSDDVVKRWEGKWQTQLAAHTLGGTNYVQSVIKGHNPQAKQDTQQFSSRDLSVGRGGLAVVNQVSNSAQNNMMRSEDFLSKDASNRDVQQFHSVREVSEELLTWNQTATTAASSHAQFRSAGHEDTNALASSVGSLLREVKIMKSSHGHVSSDIQLDPWSVTPTSAQAWRQDDLLNGTGTSTQNFLGNGISPSSTIGTNPLSNHVLSMTRGMVNKKMLSPRYAACPSMQPRMASTYAPVAPMHQIKLNMAI